MPPPAETTLPGGRGSGSELWLLRAPREALPETAPRTPSDLVQAFAEQPPELLLGAAEDEDARTLARAFACPHQAFYGAGAQEQWAELELELSGGTRRLMVVLAGRRLQALVARALDMPGERAAALAIDPGCLVLLRDDRLGLVLRRSNVHAPEREAGTQLPWSAGPDGSPTAGGVSGA